MLLFVTLLPLIFHMAAAGNRQVFGTRKPLLTSPSLPVFSLFLFSAPWLRDCHVAAVENKTRRKENAPVPNRNDTNNEIFYTRKQTTEFWIYYLTTTTTTCNNYNVFPCTGCEDLPPCKTSSTKLGKEEEGLNTGEKESVQNDPEKATSKSRNEIPNTTPLDCYMDTCCNSTTKHNMLRGYSTGCLSQKRNRTYAVIRCPLSFPDSALRKDCEEGRGTHTRDDPVTEVSTGVVYRNRHCARCHGAQHLLLPWTLHIFCEHFQDLYQKTSEEDILGSLKDADMGGDDVCDLAYLPPPGTFPPSCPSFFPDSTPHNPDPVIRTCNVTGLWKTRDSLLEQKCQDTYPRLDYLVQDSNSHERVYSNLDCARCNGFKPGKYPCRTDPPIPTMKDAPLTFLLGLHKREEQQVENEAQCSAGQWFSFDRVCRNVSCPDGKILKMENKACTTAVPMIRGLVYHVDFLLIPHSHASIIRFNNSEECETVVEQFHKAFKHRMKNLVEQFFITFAARYCDQDKVMKHITSIHVFGNIKSSHHYERDKAEENLVRHLFGSNWIITNEDQIFEFAPVITGGNKSILIHQICHEKTYHEGFEGNDHSNKIQQFFDQAAYKIVLDNLLNCAFVDFSSSDYSTKYRFINYSTDPFHDALPDNLSCKKHGVDAPGMSSDIHTSASNLKNETTHLVLMDKEISFRDLHFSWQIDMSNNLRVCVDKLEELYVRPRSSSSPWQYLLSMTAIPLSILCLCLVLLVYTLLPALRTQPGLNTMGTCFTLLLAQLLLLLSSHRLLPGTWCIALGILVPMFWLSTFCWTSVCSVHMFQAFSCKNEFHSGPGSYKSLIANTAVTLLIPGVIVAVVVVVSWHRSGGESLGYSSSSCYLQSPMLVGLALILPLSIIVTFNTVLYTVTVYRIYKICQLQECVGNETEKGHQHLTACLRLSLLTGSCWFLSILAEGMDADWLRGLSIVANGGQGMLLLLSYVVTRRVAAMLAVRFGLKSDVTSRSDAGFSTRTRHSTSGNRCNLKGAGSGTEY